VKLAASISESEERLELARQWAVEMMLKFADVFQPLVRELHLD